MSLILWCLLSVTALACFAIAHVAFGHLTSLSLAPPICKGLQPLGSSFFLSLIFLYIGHQSIDLGNRIGALTHVQVVAHLHAWLHLDWLGRHIVSQMPNESLLLAKKFLPSDFFIPGKAIWVRVVYIKILARDAFRPHKHSTPHMQRLNFEFSSPAYSSVRPCRAKSKKTGYTT
jgi:hypothetical protein